MLIVYKNNNTSKYINLMFKRGETLNQKMCYAKKAKDKFTHNSIPTTRSLNIGKNARDLTTYFRNTVFGVSIISFGDNNKRTFYLLEIRLIYT